MRANPLSAVAHDDDDDEWYTNKVSSKMGLTSL